MDKIYKLPAKIGFTILSALLAFSPVWIFILLKYLLSPEGFWQNAVTYGLGFYFLIGIQLLFLFLLIKILTIIWHE